MGKSETETILETEWDILQALWEQKRGTAREIAEALEETRGWAYSTVKTLLDRMVQKGLVSSRRVGNVYEYTPAIDQKQAARGAWKRFVNTAFSGSMLPALNFIAGDAKLTKKQKEELLKLLEGEGGKNG